MSVKPKPSMTGVYGASRETVTVLLVSFVCWATAELMYTGVNVAMSSTKSSIILTVAIISPSLM